MTSSGLNGPIPAIPIPAFDVPYAAPNATREKKQEVVHLIISFFSFIALNGELLWQLSK